MESQGEMNSTKLDIVLSGLGELPTEKVGGSIFYKLARDFNFKMDELVENEHIVGDLAFTAINASGKPVPLRKHLGSPRLEEDDIRDIAGLLEELNRPSHAVSKHLRDKLLSVNKEVFGSQRIS